MTIRNFLEMMDIEYVEDRMFFVCKGNWANEDASALVERDMTIHEILAKYGDEKIARWTIENEMFDGELVEVGFIIK